MAITAADVNKLRKMTGAGMMDCKKALSETGGDFEAAIDFLRKKGQKVAAKRADRDATEGVVLAQVNADNTAGTVIYITCETDFVSKNEDFINFATTISNAVQAEMPADKAAALAIEIDGKTIEDHLIEQVGKIGEKIEMANYATLTGDAVVAYNHAGNRIGVLVGLNKTSEDALAAGKDAAMQIAAMRAIAVDESGIDKEILDREFKVGRDQALEEGKPEAIVDKIANGRVQKFIKESTLLNQAFVKDSNLNVGQYLGSVESGLTVTAFQRVALGAL